MNYIIPIDDEPFKMFCSENEWGYLISIFPFQELVSMLDLNHLMINGADYIEQYAWTIPIEIRREVSDETLELFLINFESYIVNQLTKWFNTQYHNFSISYMHNDRYILRGKV